MWQRLVLIAFAGACGTLSRYALSVYLDRWQNQKNIRFFEIPIGTLSVNLLGCFIFGFLYALFATRLASSDTVRQIFLVGFLGSFTTFSTFAYQTGHLAEQGNLFGALGNVVLQVALGVTLAYLGILLGRQI
ncbi:MAG: fluoride efflux transporter CrcB [Candidatus Eisenbacteria bacterium]|uniref:Fluoride-specific ion channel FluC n=1 Tax=Eiseniibacteriota bacterium TaxID=2212470 RepID=A0A7Y2H226_UNCEI|nr:fluoride efflux transporter CrcB [Candidatus Eisenbacteria bacterium]